MKLRSWLYLLFFIVLAIFLIWLWSLRNQNTHFVLEGDDYSLVPKTVYKVGQKIDSLNGVYVYYNGIMSNVSGRATTPDGYNLGLQYQCVEFIKRYYYEYLNYKMPDANGNAIDFFDKTLKDGEKNVQRGLTQFSNPSETKPKLDDILIFNPTSANQFGHVAIVSKIMDKKIEIIQQNPGVNVSPRVYYSFEQKDGMWEINNRRILGWLRKE